MKNRYAIIMAGGIGSRFWPLSRKEKPKQFLDILGTGETLLQQTFSRLSSVCPPENILVVTSDEHRDLVREQTGIIPGRILTEPERRNTAPCIAYGTFRIIKENPDAVIAVTPADHFISRDNEFVSVMNSGFDFAEKENALLTIGIKPEKPETGYGYIQVDTGSCEADNIFKVRSFIEKPSLELASRFLESGDYYWNSGIFLWNARTIINAFDRLIPDIGESFRAEAEFLGKVTEAAAIKRIYGKIDSISIDYGILEKAGNVFVLTADMGWSDLGTWSSLSGHTGMDSHDNSMVSGNACVFESSGNVISTVAGKKVIIQGLQDYIVVDTADALLVIRKSDEQKIKLYLESLHD